MRFGILCLVMLLPLVSGCSKRPPVQDLYLRGRNYIVYVAPVAVAATYQRYGRSVAVKLATDIGIHCGRIQAARRGGELAAAVEEVADLVRLIAAVDDTRLDEFNAWGQAITLASIGLSVHVASFDLPDEVDWVKWTQSMIDGMMDDLTVRGLSEQLEKFEERRL